MDKHLQYVMKKRIERTVENLRKNRMQAFFVESRKDVVPLLETLMKEGDTVAVGGSMTLFEAGVIDHLRSGRYIFYDRYAEGLTPEQMTEAVNRLRQIAAPANTVRLSRRTPCVHTGYCQDCRSEDRICCDYVVLRQQMVPDRIKVILVGEELGY